MRFIVIATMIAGMVFNSVLALEGLALQTEDINKEFRGGKLFVHNMANGERKEIFSGHACGPSFSPDGKQVSFIDVKNKKIVICDLDGSNQKVVSSISYGDLGVTYWLSDGYIYYNYHNNEIFRVKVEGGPQEVFYKSSKQIHQFGISSNGKRIAWTQPGYSAVGYDMETKKERNYGGGCQGTPSPDGKYVTHNLGGHKVCTIHNWEDKSKWKDIKCPEGKFNLHRWSHHCQDYIVYSIEGKATGYVHNVVTNKATKAGKGVIWDYWDGATVSISQSQHQAAPNIVAQGIVISPLAENGVLNIFMPSKDKAVSEVFTLNGTRIYSKTLEGQGWFTMSVSAANRSTLLARVKNSQGVTIQQINAR